MQKHTFEFIKQDKDQITILYAFYLETNKDENYFLIEFDNKFYYNINNYWNIKEAYGHSGVTICRQLKRAINKVIDKKIKNSTKIIALLNDLLQLFENYSKYVLWSKTVNWPIIPYKDYGFEWYDEIGDFTVLYHDYSEDGYELIYNESNRNISKDESMLIHDNKIKQDDLNSYSSEDEFVSDNDDRDISKDVLVSYSSEDEIVSDNYDGDISKDESMSEHNNEIKQDDIIFINNDCIGCVKGLGNTKLMHFINEKNSKAAIILLNNHNIKNEIHINNFGETALMLACIEELEDVALVIIDKLGYGCYPGYYDREKNTALLFACEKNMEKVCLQMIDRFGKDCRPDIITRDKKSVLLMACECGLTKIALKMIDTFDWDCMPKHIDYDDDSALKIAIDNNMMEVVKKLLEKFGDKCKVGCLNKYYLKYINTLENGLNLDPKIDIYGNTKLMRAINRGDKHKINHIIDIYGENCKPDHVNCDGQTALILSCKYQLNDIAIKLLEKFDKTCFIDQIDKTENTVFDYIYENHELLDVLKKILEIMAKRDNNYNDNKIKILYNTVNGEILINNSSEAAKLFIELDKNVLNKNIYFDEMFFLIETFRLFYEKEINQ